MRGPLPRGLAAAVGLASLVALAIAVVRTFVRLSERLTERVEISRKVTVLKACTYGACPSRSLGRRKPCVGPKRLACCNTRFLECEGIPSLTPDDTVLPEDEEPEEPEVLEEEDPEEPSGPVIGPLPDWARQGEIRWPEKYMRNKQAVSANTTFDLVLYGDSITMFLGDNPAVWKGKFGDLNALALGIGANTIEQLAFRIIGREERPKNPPKIIALLIGINNVALGSIEPAMPRLEQLIRWLQRAYPSTRIVLLAMMRTHKWPVAGYNARYQAMAQRLGITYSACGQGLDPQNRTHMSDGVHPTAGGHTKWLTCLRALVDTMLDADDDE